MSKMFKKYKCTTAFIASSMVISFLVGLSLGYLSFGLGCLSGKVPQTSQNTFTDGWEAARQKLEKTEMFVMPGEIMSLSGTIKEARKTEIVLTAGLINPLDDESLKTRTAKITEETEVIVRRQKTEQEIAKEESIKEGKIKELQNQLANFKNGRQVTNLKTQIKNLRNQANDLENELFSLQRDGGVMNIEMQIEELEMGIAIDEYKEVVGKSSDLKAGSYIEVIADNNISQSREFTAKKIIVNDYLDIPIPADDLPVPPMPAETPEGPAPAPL